MPGKAASPMEDNVLPIYDLYATVNHYGAMYMGHYVAHVRGMSTNSNKKGDISKTITMKCLKHTQV